MPSMVGADPLKVWKMLERRAGLPRASLHGIAALQNDWHVKIAIYGNLGNKHLIEILRACKPLPYLGTAALLQVQGDIGYHTLID